MKVVARGLITIPIGEFILRKDQVAIENLKKNIAKL
jgi:hypothetical protein